MFVVIGFTEKRLNHIRGQQPAYFKIHLYFPNILFIMRSFTCNPIAMKLWWAVRTTWGYMMREGLEVEVNDSHFTTVVCQLVIEIRCQQLIWTSFWGKFVGQWMIVPNFQKSCTFTLNCRFLLNLTRLNPREAILFFRDNTLY